MKSYAQALDLKDDPALIAEYKTYHKHVWPEVKEALRAIGIQKMLIYLVGTRLFMYFEAPDSFDPERDFQKFADTKRGAAWDRLMRQFQQRIPHAKSGEWWTPMDLVFDLDW
jgi:L-rhamnose mutarotase